MRIRCITTQHDFPLATICEEMYRGNKLAMHVPFWTLAVKYETLQYIYVLISCYEATLALISINKAYVSESKSRTELKT